MNVCKLMLITSRTCLPGLVLFALAGCTGTTVAPAGIDHPANPAAVATPTVARGTVRKSDSEHLTMSTMNDTGMASMDHSHDMPSMDHGHEVSSMGQDGQSEQKDHAQRAHSHGSDTALEGTAGQTEIARLPEGTAHEHGGGHDHAGAPGTERVIEVTAVDVDFEPKSIIVKAGETIRFVVTNQGSIDHEFVVGDGAAQIAHAEEMAAMGGAMDHSHTDAIILKPGETREVVHTFGAGQNLQFACHIPGHYEAGMWGTIKIDS